jgi:DNA end-binding protein Ku
MPPRSSWKGHLKLSLVSVPVQAFTANNTSEDIRLNQLHKTCHERVRYKKVCPEHGELKNDEIESAYEYAKGQYVVIDPEEIAKLRPQSDRSIRLEGFVPPEAIDAIYLSGRTYYLTPDGAAGQKPYALLLRGMAESDVVALGEIVLAGREQLVLIRPVGKLLTMSILHVAARVRGAAPFADEVVPQETSKEELALTDTLIQASRIQDFDFASNKDGYTERLTELIRKKVEGEEIVQVPEREEPRILNLMDALKKSVAEAQAAQSQSGRKMAPSARATTRKTPKKKSG